MKVFEQILQSLREKHPTVAEEWLWQSEILNQQVDKTGLDKNFLITAPWEETQRFDEAFGNDEKDAAQKEALLLALAKFVDHCSEKNQFWYVIPTDRLHISQEGKFYFDWEKFNSFCVKDELWIPKEIFEKYGEFFPKSLASGKIDYKLLNANLAVEAFFQQMLHLLLPEIPPLSKMPLGMALLAGMTKLGLFPEEKYFLLKSYRELSAHKTCQSLVEAYSQSRKTTIFLPKENSPRLWDAAFHTEHGRSKKNQQNEDDYFFIQNEEKNGLIFMVADGVSTATVGTGKKASTRLRESIENQKLSLRTFLNELDNFDEAMFLQKAKEKITELLENANTNILKELNWQTYFEKDATYPMSTTVILGVIHNNRAMLGWLGDSHLFYYHDHKLMQLLEEHNVLYQRVCDYLENPNRAGFLLSQSDDKALTRSLPMLRYEPATQNFENAWNQEAISFISFYPEDNALLIPASDGLLDCFGGTSDPLSGEKALQSSLESLLHNGTKSKDIPRKIAREADDKAGIDNITLLILKSEKKTSAPMQKPSFPSQQAAHSQDRMHHHNENHELKSPTKPSNIKEL
jgi:serine/threonine protein phosphatase PrpC